jgi:hypothetical protein
MDIRWAKLESWHAIQHEDEAGHSTYCGRVAHGEVFENLADPGKTCESCFRIVMRMAEAIGAIG